VNPDVSKATPDIVLDSFAVLAYLEDETGAAKVEELLARASEGQSRLWLSVVNLGEVLYITEREQSMRVAQQVLSAIDQLPVTVVDADRELTLSAAHVKALHSISYADAFAVALAQQKLASICTGVPEFVKVAELVPILWLPQERG